MSLKIGIGVIHNNNELRNKSMFINIIKLKESLEEDCVVDLVYISKQTNKGRHSKLEVIKRNYVYMMLDRQWSIYRGIRFSFIRSILGICKKNMYITKKHRKSSLIETIVTDKHIRAWGNLIENNDYIMIFEDDVIFKDDSILKIKILFNKILLEKYNSNLYIDLAGGCSLDSLKINKLEHSRDDNYIYYSKIVTNTACAYLLSKELVMNFMKILLFKPELRQIGVDWMMNKLAIELEKDSGASINCSHSSPTIFLHGSVTGTFDPWER